MGEDRHPEELTRDIASTRADLTRDVEALADRVSPSRVVERRKERVKSRFASVKESVMGSANDVGESVTSSVSSTGSSVTSAAGSSVETARRKTQGNPLAAGLVAFGVGWLVSSVLPASEKETKAARTLEEAAKEHGQPIAEQAQQIGREVGQNLEESAQQAAQDVKDTAQQSKDRVADEGRSSAEAVREESRTS